MPRSVVIAEEFRGPPQSGNGGYVTGVFGGLLAGGRFDLPAQRAPEVTLRAPVPLDQPLQVELAGEGVRVMDGARLIAEVELRTLELEIPEPASWEAALAAQPRSAALIRAHHPWLGAERLGFHPICFCCGAELPEARGLHVYPAAIAELRQVAAAWRCHPRFGDEHGHAPAPIVCTALDCPGQFAWLAEGTRTGMLGRLCVRIEAPVRVAEPHVVIGWTLGNEGRKYYAGTALFDAAGKLCAYAKAVWIGLPPS